MKLQDVLDLNILLVSECIVILSRKIERVIIHVTVNYDSLLNNY